MKPAWVLLLSIMVLMACGRVKNAPVEDDIVKADRPAVGNAPVPTGAIQSYKPSVVVSPERAEGDSVDLMLTQDSLYADTMLQDMLAVAKSNKKKHIYKAHREWPNFNRQASANMRLGFLFDGTTRHLTITRLLISSVRTDVYVVQNNGFKKLFGREDDRFAFIKDSIADINGDGVRDWIVLTYPVSGCCRRNVYSVYLYNPIIHSFNKGYEFINPTFYASQKLIRGVAYGHPGEVPLYKYRWDGAKVDTIEYIYPADTLKKRFYKVRRWEDLDDPAKRQELKAIPAEYRHIAAIDWFNKH